MTNIFCADLRQVLQELFQSQMGICLEDIGKLAPLSPEEKFLQTGSQLEGAHLPPRGFYFIKPTRASQSHVPSSSGHTFTGVSDWLPFWRRTTKESALTHPSGDPVGSSLDKNTAVSDSQSGELELEVP